MSNVKFEDNSAEVLSALDAAIARGLEIIGGRAETHAKELCPVDTGNLRNSITHQVVSEDTVQIGSNVVYAPYVELGTGPHFTPPPEWMQDNAERGSGIGKSFVKPRPYLRPAIENYREEYKQIIESELKRG